MNLADVALALGPMGAVVLLPAAGAAIAVRRQQWALWAGGLLTLVTVAGWLAFWITWGTAFDLADTMQQMPASLESRQDFFAGVTALAAVTLAVTAVASLARKASGSSAA